MHLLGDAPGSRVWTVKRDGEVRLAVPLPWATGKLAVRTEQSWPLYPREAHSSLRGAVCSHPAPGVPSGAPDSLADVESRGLSRPAPPPRVCGGVDLALPAPTTQVAKGPALVGIFREPTSASAMFKAVEM